MSQMNDKYLKKLKLRLSNSPKLQNSPFISEKSNFRKMTAKQILSRENEKMKSNYEKAKVYEKALDSIEDSLSSKVNIIKLKDEKIEQLQNRIQKLNELIKSLQEATLGTKNKFQEQKESLQQISTLENLLNQQIYENKKREYKYQDLENQNASILNRINEKVSERDCLRKFNKSQINEILTLRSDLKTVHNDLVVEFSNIILNLQEELANKSNLLALSKSNSKIVQNNLILKSKVYSLESSLKDVKSSYSWKIGYKITRVIFGLFRWTSFIKNRL
ncbi:hypothetical protein N9P71_01010 [Saprospiraceae bacterium]|nr:hypothetical protein [Saprospiraceae bacterium]